MISGAARTYSLHVRCPYGDHDDWISLQSRFESLEQVLAAPCGFDCPTHGAQQEFPLEGIEKTASPAASKKSFPVFSPAQKKRPLAPANVHLFMSRSSSMAGAKPSALFTNRPPPSCSMPAALWSGSPLPLRSAKVFFSSANLRRKSTRFASFSRNRTSRVGMK